MKIIITIAIAVILSVLALVIAGRMRSSDGVVARSALTDGKKVMVAQKHASDGGALGDERKPMSVTFYFPEGWMFDAYPDGSICGQLGSGFGDSILLPRGTVDFSDIVKSVETAIETKPERKAVHASVRYKGGGRSVTLKPIEDNGYFRRLFLVHRNSWRNYRGNISPKEVEELLQSVEYYKEAEQASTGQPATVPESKSEGSDKPQPESERRSR